MQFVSVAQQEGTVRLFHLVEDCPPFRRKIAQDGIPGIKNLPVGDIPIKIFSKDLKKFRFLYFTCFKAEEETLVCIVGKGFIEMMKSQVFECKDDGIYIQVRYNAPPVKNYVLNFGNINI